MSYTLGCHLEVRTGYTAVDWWTLLSECLEQHGFVYSAPKRPDGESWFFSTHFPANNSQESETELCWGSFHALLKNAAELEHTLVKGEYSSLIAAFWSADDEGFYLEPQLSLKGLGRFSLDLNIDGANFMAISMERLQSRVRQILACSQTLWEMSQPSHGEICWNSGDLYASCATFGIVPHLPDSIREAYSEKSLRYVEQVGKYGAKFFIADPFPVPQFEGNNWKFISPWK